MARAASSQPVLLLLLLLLLHGGSSQTTVEVDKKQVELEESGESLGEEFRLPLRSRESLSCKLKSSSELASPQISWSLPGKATLQDERFQTSESLSADKKEFVSTLTIKNLQNSDIGEYACNASADGVSSASKVGGLTSPPLLTLLVDGKRTLDKSVWPGNSVEVECQVEGSPAGNVTWSRDGRQQPLSRGRKLVIQDVNFEEHRGYFTCESRNQLGRNSAKLYLRVKNPTGFVLPMIVVIVEIVLIAIIVVVYELMMRKKRRQQEANEAKTD